MFYVHMTSSAWRSASCAQTVRRQTQRASGLRSFLKVVTALGVINMLPPITERGGRLDKPNVAVVYHVHRT